jgi:hypothetical protein
VVPICAAIAIATVNMLLVYRAVRQQMITARKWQFGGAAKQQQQVTKSPLARNADVSGKSFEPRRPERGPQTAIQTMERQVFWQALFYLGAFYLAWPILLASNLNEEAGGVYPFMIATFTLAPMQGFLNFLVYARPRIQNLLKERRKTSRSLQQASKGTPATSEGTPVAS